MAPPTDTAGGIDLFASRRALISLAGKKLYVLFLGSRELQWVKT